MSAKNMDSPSTNLCIPEDAFEQFQAVSMYQEEEYITLPHVVSPDSKEPEPGDISHIHYDNEVVISSDNGVNSTVNDNTEEVERETEPKAYSESCLEVPQNLNNATNNVVEVCKPQHVTRQSKRKKSIAEDRSKKVSNDHDHNDIQVSTEQISPIISSTIPRKRGRKPKPKEPVTPSSLTQDPISSTPLNLDPENVSLGINSKRKRGRPRKVSAQNDTKLIVSDKEFSSELSGSDSNRIDDHFAPRRRGRPRKKQLEAKPQSDITNTETTPNNLIGIDLNGTQPNKTYESSKETFELDISNNEQTDMDDKIKTDGGLAGNADIDDLSLTKLKGHPTSCQPVDDNYLNENDTDYNLTDSSIKNTNLTNNDKDKSPKKRRGKPQKGHINSTKKDRVKPDTVAENSYNNKPVIESSVIQSDDNEDISLIKLKEIESVTGSTDNNNTTVVSPSSDDPVIEVGVESSIETPAKRNSKMPVMSDFEYNVDSVLDKDITGNEITVDNDLLVESTSKRPVRRKVPKLRYEEESDEDPFANVELSDDDEPKRRKGTKYYSDDEYIPDRRGNKDIDSTDSEAAENALIKKFEKQKRKVYRKKSDNQSPQKKGKTDPPIQEIESDVEVCVEPSGDSVSVESSKLWSCSNEFENFIAKKIQGTNLKIKKVSSNVPMENKTLEIPVIDPDAKKTIEMCTQTNIVQTLSTAVQTNTPYDIPMKENISLTSEQSEKACYFLNSIVKTTSELGTLMTQKSEDFIKKKINTTHVTDTMKMDYCVRKSFLLFKLAKHNLMQMEEDLAKQYDEFLKSNNLTECREEPKQIVASTKQTTSDSDCEIVEEPVKVMPAKISKEKAVFNPKTVFLNKELSIKIAKKPTENKKLDIEGRHTVWINDTVMVKKVKPVQSFLAQDSRNKKPPDNIITTKMVSDFFKNYYHEKAISFCAPFLTTEWLTMSKECVCNYFVVKPVQFNNDVNCSTSSGIATHASTSESNHDIKYMPNKTIETGPETLFKLCFRIVKNQVNDKRNVKEVCQHIQNELTDRKIQPVTLFRLSLRVLNCRAGSTLKRSPRSPKTIAHKDVSAVPSLKTLCYQRMVIILFNSRKAIPEDCMGKQDVAETRCSTDEYNDLLPTFSFKHPSPSIRIEEIKSLFSLCVEYIQKKLFLDSKNNNIITIPKSLKSCAFEHVKQLMFRDINVSSYDTSKHNLSQYNYDISIKSLTINSVNTLSEEAFLKLDQSHSPDYLVDFDNEDFYEPDFNEIEEENPTDTSWVSQVQMQELRSCCNNTNLDVHEDNTVSVVTQIKLEPSDDLPDNVELFGHVKTEPIAGPDEMTIIPEVKVEVLDNLKSGPIERHNSNSYDVDAFEQFVATNKIMHELTDDDIFSQSAHRVRRQHEPDYEEDDMSMSLLVPQTYEPLSIETAKGSLMESSSEDDSSKNKKVTSKKKPDKRKSKQKKPDPKAIIKETTLPTVKDKPSHEVANLTKRMRDRIRQEEKKVESSDSETETVPLRLRNKKELEKPKPTQTSKAKESEIQCNNVDSTDQVDDDINSFTGFTPIDQNEMSTYQKYMEYVYDKVVPDKEGDISKHVKSAKEEERAEKPLISDEPVELLECEPTIPSLDDSLSSRRSSRKLKRNSKIAKKEEVLKQETNSKKLLTAKQDAIEQEKVSATPSFIERHGWHCYPVNRGDVKLYQSTYIALEKLPESFVQTYFEYQGINRKNVDDQEIDRLTNLNSLNRTVQLQNISKNKPKLKREAKSNHIPEAVSRSHSPYSDRYAELEPSDDERANIDDEVAPPVATRHTENSLAKNLLMDENDSDSDSTKVEVKQEPSNGTEPKNNFKTKSKNNDNVAVDDSEELMLTADKMMNKELSLLHAPAVVTDDVKPTEGRITRNKQRIATKNQSSTSKTKTEEDSSSEEEKQWVSTKEKLLKRMGKKDQSSVDDAKRAKLVSEFIERRGGTPDSHMRNRSGRTRRSGKKFLERQKQLKVLSRELFGEPVDGHMAKRSQATLHKGRRNIRKVIDKKSLARSTVVANMEEFERKRRLNARQTKLRELMGCEEGVNVLVINDEVCLEYDFEENRPVVTVHPFFTKVMKAHQYEGVKFMWDACFESLSEIAAGRPGGGCILAHCMGLGKTLQVLALLHTVLTHPGVKMQRVLVCCPLSTVLNWVDEIHKWIGPVTNEIKVFELSKLKKTYERAYQLEDWYNGGGIFIIGYELFRSLSTLDPFLDDVRPTIVNKIRTALLDPGPDIIVCDEGHLLKNDCSVLAVAMSRVVTKRRIILTGTPMQNNLREYYCMVNFVKPNLLGTYSEYSNRFENPIMNGQHRDSREEDIKLMKARTHILHKVLEGCLQRQEASVLYPYLPKKYEYTVFITLTPCQWDLYKHYLRNYGKQSKQSILKDFHILQKIWSHPQVLHNFQTKARDRDERNKIKAEKLEDDLATEDLEEIKPNATEDLWWLEYLDGGNMLETLDSSNKFVVVFKILDECVALGDKVLIFSTSLFCLDALEYFLKKIKKWSLGNEYYRLDGSVPAEVRQKWCREFNADNNTKTKLFLVSTRAGCLGLNMTAANRVIILDTSWNPAHDIQSIFRVYRFGQKKDCYIYRLVAMGTMEQKIYERSVTKQAVACRVVDEQQIDRHYNMAELTELYKYDCGGSGVAGGVAVGVRDVALLRVARHHALHAVHEHDSLLRGSAEQGLPEHERNAAWMQFQQEQQHKEIENKLVEHNPKVALKRLQNQEESATTTVKQEDTSNDYTVKEPKTKKGKKFTVAKCGTPPVENDDNQKMPTRGSTKKDQARPGTSTQLDVASSSNSIPDNAFEEIMVEKITDILLKHNFQWKKEGTPHIAELVKKVRNIVQKGYIEAEDMADELTVSIAQVLLPKQMSLPAVTDIMCESINNSAVPDAVSDDADPELITSDPSVSNRYPTKTMNDTELRTKRKAAIAAEKNIDSMVQGVVINLDDDKYASDDDFLPDENITTNKTKNKTKNSSTSVDTDENTLSADETKLNKVVINVTNSKSIEQCNISEHDNNTSVPKKTVGRKKPKDRTITTYSKTECKKLVVDLPSTSDPEPVDRGSLSSIVLSDDEEPTLSLTTTKNIVKQGSKPPDSIVPVDDEVVPLPMLLLKNQNFINIVAHTYLVGNPMLDEDAATLAAQYSTLKAYKEAEQTGQNVCSGPIYDIAMKVIGKEVLKKMQSGNPIAAASSAYDAVTTIQMKEQMIATQKTFEEAAKSAKLRKEMIEKKLSMNKTKAPEVQPSASDTTSISTVVPVGLIKTTTCTKSTLSYGQPMLSPPRVEPRVECILPDDDDLIISDIRATPAPTAKPIILNNVTYNSKTRGFEPRSPKLAVGVGTSVSTPKSNTPPKIVIKPYSALTPVKIVQNTVTKLQASTPTKVVPEQILPNDGTICLDSDDEESMMGCAAAHTQPVPVSLTSAQAPGVKLPLPAMPQIVSSQSHATNQPPAQTLMLRQVMTPDGVQPKYVLIPSDQLPMPILSKATDPPTTTPLVPVNPINSSSAETIVASKKPDACRAKCKPGDILRITKSGAIEVLSRGDDNSTGMPAASPAKINSTAPQLKQIAPKNNDLAAVSNPKPVIAKNNASGSIDRTNKNPEVTMPIRPAIQKTKTETSKVTNVTATGTKSKPILLKAVSASFDLTSTDSEADKPILARKISIPGNVGLTNTVTRLRTIPPKPTATTTAPMTIDLSKIETAVSNTDNTTKPLDMYKNQKTGESRKTRQISSSSSNTSRPSSPDNPLSILKDVVHIKAVDYPSTADDSFTTHTQKFKTSNISVQHVVSSEPKNTKSKGLIKLKRVPKDQVPKHIDEAVEKQIRQEALMKKVKPLLGKIQLPVKDSTSRGRNTISFDNLSCSQTSSLLKNRLAATSSNTTKVDSKLTKSADTVDLTKMLCTGTTVTTKSESKKRQSSSTETTLVKKKKSQPMTLKDFDLDDIDDIIELE